MRFYKGTLDNLIVEEDKFLSKRMGLPTELRIGYRLLLCLIKELNLSSHVGEIHGMKIIVTPKEVIEIV